MPDLREMIRALTPTVPLPEGLDTRTTANGIDAAGNVLVYQPPEVIEFAGAGGPFLPLSGGQLTGPLLLAGDPVQPLEAASKSYVDEAVARGGTLIGPLNWTATGSNTSRSAQDRSADRINVLDFGAIGDGVTDDFAAVSAARNSRPSGSEVNLWFPGNRTYHLSAAVQPNGRTLFFDVDPTSSLNTPTGGVFGPYFWTVAAGASQGQSRWETFVGAPQWYQTVGRVYDIVNDGSGGTGNTGGYGIRTNYITHTVGTTSRFDILRGDLMAVATPSVTPGSQWTTNWSTLGSPLDTVNQWGAFVAEFNPINRGDDTGWTNIRSGVARWTGGLQVVPEGVDFFGSGTGRNVTYALGVMRSASINSLGFNAQSYNALLIERNAIAPGGRGIYIGGYQAAPNVPTTEPTSAIEIDLAWRYGIDLSNATFSNAAIVSPYFMLDPNGNVQATSLTTTGTVQSGGAITVGTGAATINSGPGVPGGVAPAGSLILRTDGGPGERLYVSNGSGTWNAVTGV